MNPIDTKNSIPDGLALDKPTRVASDKLGQEQFLELMIAQLKNQGILSEEEFEAKKKQILGI